MYRLELTTNLRNCTLAGFREEQLLTRRESGKGGQVVAAHLTAELAHLTSGGGGGNQQDSKSGLCRRYNQGFCHNSDNSCTTSWPTCAHMRAVMSEFWTLFTAGVQWLSKNVSSTAARWLNSGSLDSKRAQ